MTVTTLHGCVPCGVLGTHEDGRISGLNVISFTSQSYSVGDRLTVDGVDYEVSRQEEHRHEDKVASQDATNG